MEDTFLCYFASLFQWNTIKVNKVYIISVVDFVSLIDQFNPVNLARISNQVRNFIKCKN